jgi:hypothetical protein
VYWVIEYCLQPLPFYGNHIDGNEIAVGWFLGRMGHAKNLSLRKPDKFAARHAVRRASTSSAKSTPARDFNVCVSDYKPPSASELYKDSPKPGQRYAYSALQGK